MGYKDMVLGQLTQTAINERDNVYFKMAQEVEEVYHKAEILNKIVDIIKTGRSLNSNIDFEIIVLAIEHELIYLEDE